MFTVEEKMRMVEEGIKEFAINPKFRDCLRWFVDMIDKQFDNRMEQECKKCFEDIDNCYVHPKGKLKGKLVGKYKLVKIN